MNNNIIINTAVLSDCVKELDNEVRYYSNKKSTFSSSNFGYNTKLNNYLSKIQATYTNISTNIKTVADILKDYSSDVEALENNFSNHYGYIKIGDVSACANRYKNIIKKIYLDDDPLFKISASYNGSNIGPAWNDPNLKSKEFGANLAICGLAFTEGILNVAEMIGDGGALLVSGASSLLGNDEFASKIGDFIKNDWSKELYYNTVSKTGLDKYGDPNSTAANISSMVGTMAGTIALSVATGGIASSIFGVSSTAAAVTTMTGRGITMALSNAGGEAETSLKNGASIKSAQSVGVEGAFIGAAAGIISGGLDDSARVAGATMGKLGLSKIVGYSAASFGIGASEPLINLGFHTYSYRNDKDLTFFENLKKNAREDNLLFSMLLAGGMNAGGTFFNGLGGIKTYNLNVTQELPKFDLNATEEMPVFDVTEEMPIFHDETLKRDLTLEEIDIKIKVKEGILKKYPELESMTEADINSQKNELRMAYKALKDLDAEISTGKGNVNGYEARMLKKAVDAKARLNSLPLLTEGSDYLIHKDIIMEHPVEFYSKNKDYFSDKFISFEKYLKETNVDIGDYKYTQKGLAEAALDFGEKSMILCAKADDLLNQSDTNFELKLSIRKALGSSDGEISRTYNINEDELEKILMPYFSDVEKEALAKIGSSKFKMQLTEQQQKTVYQFTRAGGCDIDNYLRGERMVNSITDIEHMMNKFNMEQDGAQFGRQISSDKSIIEEMIDIIEQNSNKKMVKAVRYVDDLGPSGNISVDNIHEFIGKTFTDDAFGSFTLINDYQSSYARKSIRIDTYIEPGSGALIQGASALSTYTSEFLVKPGYKLTIVDGAYDASIDKVVLKAIVSGN